MVTMTSRGAAVPGDSWDRGPARPTPGTALPLQSHVSFLRTGGRDLPLPLPFCSCFREAEKQTPSFRCAQQWEWVLEQGRSGLSPSELSLSVTERH